MKKGNLKRQLTAAIAACALVLVGAGLAACAPSGAGDSSEEIHAYGGWSTSVPPTCTKEGEEKRTCPVCGKTEERKLPALGHDYGSRVVEPTCTEGGYTVRVCARCSESCEDDFTDPAGHDYIETAVAPTCTEGGYTLHVCGACGDSYTDGETEALGHDFEVFPAVEATCTRAGYLPKVCARCGRREEDEVSPALGHDFAGSFDICARCGGIKDGCVTSWDATYGEDGAVTAYLQRIDGDGYRVVYGGEGTALLDPSVWLYRSGPYKVVELGFTDGVTAVEAMKFLVTDVERAIFDDCVERLGDYTCAVLSGLRELRLGSGIKRTGKLALGSPQSIYYPGTPEEWAAIEFGARTDDFWVSSFEADLYVGGELLTEARFGSSVREIKPYAFFGIKSIGAVSFSEGLTEIGAYAFSRVPLGDGGELNLPDSLVSLGAYAFCATTGSSCTFASASFGGGLQSLGAYAFRAERILYGGTVGDFCRLNRSSLTPTELYIGGEPISSLTVPESLSELGGYAFQGLLGLTELRFGTGVKQIGGYAFSATGPALVIRYEGTPADWCRIKFGNNYRSSEFSICFNGEETPTEAIVLDGSAPEIPDYAFSCAKIKSVEIGEGVKRIGRFAFGNCSYLSDFTIGGDVESIGEGAFSGCGVGLPVRMRLSEKTTALGLNAFQGCLIAYVEVAAENPVYSDEDGVLFNKEKTELILFPRAYAAESYTAPSSVKKVSACAFWGARNLKSVVFPDSVTEIGEQAFYCATALESAVLGNGALTIGELAFAGCRALNCVRIGTGVREIGNYAFSYAPISDIRIASEHGIRIARYAFYNSELFRNESYWEDDALYVGRYLVSVRSSRAGSFSVKEGTKAIADYAFYACRNLTEVLLPEGLELLGEGVFYNAMGLEEGGPAGLVIPDSVTEIGAQCFFGAFFGYIVIGSGVKSIGGGALENEDLFLSGYYYRGTKETWAEIELGDPDAPTDLLCFYSETRPTEKGDYWHYEDGVPARW